MSKSQIPLGANTAHLRSSLTLSEEPSAQDSANFFKASSYRHDYWNDYLLLRPTYSEDFYDLILDYHKEHNPSRAKSVAHDVGTGPGQVAIELSKHFDTIVASDANFTHLQVAADRAEHAGVQNQITWLPVRAEELAESSPRASASLVVAAECLPLLNIPQAMNAFTHLLHGDGTLAIWFYGRPAFSESEYASVCQPLMGDIIDLMFAETVKGGNATHKAAWKSATDTMQSWLDNVALPSDIWSDVHRYKWNSQLQMSMNGPDACDFPIETSSSIDTKREKVIIKDDPQLWAKSWNVEDVKQFVEQLLPNVKDLKAEGRLEHIEPKYRELAQAMGGEKTRRAIMWPVVLILATRR